MTETMREAGGPLGLAVVAPGGRMGAAVDALARADDGWHVTARVVGPDQDGTRLADLDAAAVAATDVMIDFSHRSAVVEHAAFCAEHGVAWVLGTTGLDAADRAAVARASRETVVFQASNFSVGVALLADLAARAARVLGLDADVEIVESHHHHKVDAPSGTALTLAEAVAGARGQELDAAMTHGRAGEPGARPRGEIGMHALRMADIVGRHTVHFAWPLEGIRLHHEARDRRVFAAGALRAGRFAHGQRLAGKTGSLGMSDLLAEAER